MVLIPPMGIFSITFAAIFLMRQILNTVGIGAMAFF
jgi:hypothetical protein